MTATQFAPAAMPNASAEQRAVDRVAEAAHRLNEAVQREEIRRGVSASSTSTRSARTWATLSRKWSLENAP